MRDWGKSQGQASKSKSGFKVKWVKFPLRWLERLRVSDVGPATYLLATTILVENFKLDQMVVKEIVLSEKVTGLSRGPRQRAINNLVRLKLIKVKRGLGQAIRVVDLYY
jgi:hypothetical protein